MESQREMVITALRMRANYIETGDVCLSRNDAIASKSLAIIKSTTTEQEELISTLRKMANELENADAQRS